MRVRNDTVKCVVLHLTPKQKEWLDQQAALVWQSKRTWIVNRVREQFADGFEHNPRPRERMSHKEKRERKLRVEDKVQFYLEIPLPLYTSILESLTPLPTRRLWPTDVVAWIMHAVFPELTRTRYIPLFVTV